MKEHDWRNNGYNDYLCRQCRLDDYGAEGTGPCRNRRVYACQLQYNRWTHGLCTMLFESRQEALTHWDEAGHQALRTATLARSGTARREGQA